MKKLLIFDFSLTLEDQYGRVPKEIRQLLCACHEEGLSLGIVTRASRRHVEESLGPEISSLFEVIFDPTHPVKPDPATVEELHLRTAVSPEETLVIGDELVDWQLAQNAGVDFAVACWFVGNKHAFPAKTRCFHTPAELAAWLGIKGLGACGKT